MPLLHQIFDLLHLHFAILAKTIQYSAYYASTLVDWGIMFLDCPYLCLSHFCECDISRTPWRKFFIGLDFIHSDSEMSWLHFSGQGHCNLTSVPFLSMQNLRNKGISLHLAQTYTWSINLDRLQLGWLVKSYNHEVVILVISNEP